MKSFLLILFYVTLSISGICQSNISISNDCPLVLDTLIYPTDGIESSSGASFGRYSALNGDVLLASNNLKQEIEIYKISNNGQLLKHSVVNYPFKKFPFNMWFNGDTLISDFRIDSLIVLHVLVRNGSDTQLNLLKTYKHPPVSGSMQAMKGNIIYKSINDSSFKNNNGAIVEILLNENGYQILDTIYAAAPKENGRIGSQIHVLNDRLVTLESFPRKLHIFNKVNNEWVDQEFNFSNKFISNFIVDNDTIWVSLSDYFAVQKGNVIKMVHENGNWQQIPLSTQGIDGLSDIKKSGNEFITSGPQGPRRVYQSGSNIWKSIEIIQNFTTYTGQVNWHANDSSLAYVNYTNMDKGNNSGAIVVYKKSHDLDWAAKSITYVPPSTDSRLFAMGRNVKIKNTHLLTLVSHTDSTGTRNAVYLYQKAGDTYNRFIFKSPTTSASDGFGNSFDIHDNKLVIGCSGCRDNPNDPLGIVYIYTQDSIGKWNESILKEPGIESNRNTFGRRVILNGDQLLVSSGYVNGTITGDGQIIGYYGRLYDFRNDTVFHYDLGSEYNNGEDFASNIAVEGNKLLLTSWVPFGECKTIFYEILNDTILKLQQFMDNNPNEQYFGRGLDFKNNLAVVSSPLSGLDNVFRSGKLYIYKFNGNSFDESIYIPDNIPSTGFIGNYGLSVGINNEKIISLNYSNNLTFEQLSYINNLWVREEDLNFSGQQIAIEND